MNILYLHGLHSNPNSRKTKFLREQGHQVITPRLPDDDFDLAYRIAATTAAAHDLDVIVGSGRGGAVAMKAVQFAHGDTPLVLICPAWRRYLGQVLPLTENTVILHSPHDEEVPITDSQDIHSLIFKEVGESHRMNNQEAQQALLDAINEIVIARFGKLVSVANEEGNNGSSHN
jgi:predicted esterase YcpF (UPF0227 family)